MMMILLVPHFLRMDTVALTVHAIMEQTEDNSMICSGTYA